MRRLPPLTAIRAFEAVGRFGVQRAAAELNVTPAAIYHQIRALEADLEIQLFTRDKGKGLTLTLDGDQFLSEIISIFDRLYASVNRVKSDVDMTELTVDALTSFALGFLMPRIGDFIAKHPDIDLKIITPKNPLGRIRFAQTGAHVAIRGGAAAAQWPDMHAERLCHETMFPVCSPKYLEKFELSSPKDLAGAQLIDVVGTPEGWADWLEEADRCGHDVGSVNLDEAFKVDLIHLATEAARDGIGVNLARSPLVDHYLASGDLVAPFDIRIRSTLSYWMIAPPSNLEAEAVIKFRDWLFEHLADAA